MFQLDGKGGVAVSAPAVNTDPTVIAAVKNMVRATLPEDMQDATLLVQEVQCDGEQLLIVASAVTQHSFQSLAALQSKHLLPCLRMNRGASKPRFCSLLRT
jgi:hypothetical protein